MTTILKKNRTTKPCGVNFMEKFSVGKIVKAQGIKGEVKIKCSFGEASLLKGIKTLFVKDSPFTVKSMRLDGDFAYVHFSTVADRNAAEALVGMDVFADKDSVKLDADSYFVDDMLGSRVVLDDGTSLGVVDDILQNERCAEVYYVTTPKGRAAFPFLKDLVKSFDPKEKLLTLFSKRFEEVVLYED